MVVRHKEGQQQHKKRRNSSTLSGNVTNFWVILPKPKVGPNISERRCILLRASGGIFFKKTALLKMLLLHSPSDNVLAACSMSFNVDH